MKLFHVDFVLVHDAKGGQRMKTSWYSDNASVEEIVKVLKQYPSYKTSFLEDIVSQKEKIFLNNPTEVDGSEELFERLYEIAELPNRILSGYTYRNIFYEIYYHLLLNLGKDVIIKKISKIKKQICLCQRRIL